MNDVVDQRSHWEKVYTISPCRFGNRPSFMGISALPLLIEAGAGKILELGCGQGRDTLLFLENNMEVFAFDYASTCINQLVEIAKNEGISSRLHAYVHDLRDGIPLPDSSMDACFSHMFFTMYLTEREIANIMDEVRRVLRPGGLNIYSVRNQNDPHFGNGRWIGEDLWEMNGFVVHYFSEEKIRRLSKGFEILGIEEFEEGNLPKKLYKVVLKKPEK